jgi:hypothetical protein
MGGGKQGHRGKILDPPLFGKKLFPLPKKTKKVMININSTGDENNNECKSLKGGSYDLEQAGPGLCAITAMIAERGKVLSNSE